MNHEAVRSLKNRFVQVVLATLKAASAWDAQRFVADPLTFYAERDGTDVMKKDGLTLELKRPSMVFLPLMSMVHVSMRQRKCDISRSVELAYDETNTFPR